MSVWFIPLGLALMAFGIFWLVFRTQFAKFLTDLFDMMGMNREGAIIRPTNTPVAGAIGFILVGAVFLGAEIVAIVIAR